MKPLPKAAREQLVLPELPSGYVWKITRGSFPAVFVRRRRLCFDEDVAIVSVRYSQGYSLQGKYQTAIYECHSRAKKNIKEWERDQEFLRGLK